MQRGSLTVLILFGVLQACSPLGDPVDVSLSDNFYYNNAQTDIIYSRMGNWFELGQNSLGADAKTFEVLNANIGRDQHRAYYCEHAIEHPDFDLESFHTQTAIFMSHTGMDKNHVYVFKDDVIDGEWQLIIQIVEGADPMSFTTYDFRWSKDDYHHFYNYEVIDVDYPSFRIVNETFAKDSARVYIYDGNKFDKCDANASTFRKMDDHYARDDQYVFLFLDYQEEQDQLRKIPYTDLGQVRLLGKKHLKVDNKVFYQGIPIEGLNTSQAVVLKHDHIKDHERVFYGTEWIEEAHAPSFRYNDEKYVFEDKNHQYRGAEVLDVKL